MPPGTRLSGERAGIREAESETRSRAAGSLAGLERCAVTGGIPRAFAFDLARRFCYLPVLVPQGTRRSSKEVFMEVRTFLAALLPAVLFGAAVFAAAQTANPVVVIKTNKGDITIELDAAKAPISVKNFLSYVDEKFYDGTIFHRVIKGFMIQGGGLTPDFVEKKAKAPIRNEAGNGLQNRRGSIAMARTQDLNSATCQFYINHVDNFALDDMKYAVFGRVLQGIDVVDAIANVPTGTIKGYADAPRQPITIASIRRQTATK